jgi:hypothetical protein
MLNEIEVSRLNQCEAVIERGMKTFVDVGNALLEIREKRLYRVEFGTFEDYCRERWGMVRQQANRLISAAEVVEILEPMGSILPATERQVRPLTSLEPEQQREVWAQVIDTTPPERITAAVVQTAVNEYQNKPHVSFNSGNNEWYTPPEFIEAARKVMGKIDFDPASSEIANRTVKATKYCTAEDDGLLWAWGGKVWMNPPYAGELIGRFCFKLVDHFERGEIEEAIILVNNSTETAWFDRLIDCASAVVFPKTRVKFIDMNGKPSGAPLQGQAIIYLGRHGYKFIEAFSQFGWGATVWHK